MSSSEARRERAKVAKKEGLASFTTCIKERPLDLTLRRLSRKVAKEGLCEICERAAPLVIDHSHDTGAIRGWLCVRCNVELRALDDREWFKKAEAYRVAHK